MLTGCQSSQPCLQYHIQPSFYNMIGAKYAAGAIWKPGLDFNIISSQFYTVCSVLNVPQATANMKTEIWFGVMNIPKLTKIWEEKVDTLWRQATDNPVFYRCSRHTNSVLQSMNKHAQNISMYRLVCLQPPSYCINSTKTLHQQYHQPFSLHV